MAIAFRVKKTLQIHSLNSLTLNKSKLLHCSRGFVENIPTNLAHIGSRRSNQQIRVPIDVSRNEGSPEHHHRNTKVYTRRKTLG